MSSLSIKLNKPKPKAKPTKPSKAIIKALNAATKSMPAPRPKSQPSSRPMQGYMTAKNIQMANLFCRTLRSPFDPKALGCRVPDTYSFPTATYHCHGTTVLGTAAGNTFGSVLFFPNPVLSMMDTHLESTLSTSVINNSMGTYTNNPSVYGAVMTGGASTLSSVLSDFRVVAGGIKITNLQPEMTATGRIIISLIPITDTMPDYNSLVALSGLASNLPLLATNYTAANLDSARMLNLPASFELAVQDLLHGDVQIAFPVVSARYYDFRSSAANVAYTATSSVSDVQISNSVGATTSSGIRDPTRCNGGCAISVYYEGIPASTTAFQVEYIYHLEGSPNLSSNAALPVSSDRKSVV